jgi:hypothetical protein
MQSVFRSQRISVFTSLVVSYFAVLLDRTSIVCIYESASIIDVP